MKKMTSRKLSFTERGHLVYDGVFSGFYCRLILEGEGEIDIENLRVALKEASDINPNPRMRLRGFLNFCRLVDSGEPPPVRIVESHEWDGLSSRSAEFLNLPLSPRSGPSCDVLIVKGAPYRIIFRAHHTVMDGRGVHLWAEDVFKILNGKKTVSCFSGFTELEFTRRFTGEYRKPFPLYSPAPTGRADNFSSLKPRWIRRRINGHYKNLIGQIAVIIASEVAKYRDGDFWISIPADLRHRNDNYLTTSNFASLIYVNIRPGYTPEQISEEIKKKIADAEDLKFDRGDVLCRYVPVFILKKILTSMMRKRHGAGIYSTSFSISNIGLINLDDYTCRGFTPKHAFGCPSGGFYPLNVVLLGAGGSIEIGMAMPEVLASNGRLEALMDRVVNGLKAKG